MRFVSEVMCPEAVEVSVTVTMAVKEWREIADALKSERYAERWVAAKFCDELRTVLRKVESQALGVVYNEKDEQ